MASSLIKKKLDHGFFNPASFLKRKNRLNGLNRKLCAHSRKLFPPPTLQSKKGAAVSVQHPIHGGNMPESTGTENPRVSSVQFKRIDAFMMHNGRKMAVVTQPTAARKTNVFFLSSGQSLLALEILSKERDNTFYILSLLKIFLFSYIFRLLNCGDGRLLHRDAAVLVASELHDHRIVCDVDHCSIKTACC